MAIDYPQLHALCRTLAAWADEDGDYVAFDRYRRLEDYLIERAARAAPTQTTTLRVNYPVTQRAQELLQEQVQTQPVSTGTPDQIDALLAPGCTYTRYCDEAGGHVHTLRTPDHTVQAPTLRQLVQRAAVLMGATVCSGGTCGD